MKKMCDFLKYRKSAVLDSSVKRCIIYMAKPFQSQCVSYDRTELKAMAAPAKASDRYPPAATGMSRLL